jgi:hypothetical protein
MNKFRRFVSSLVVSTMLFSQLAHAGYEYRVYYDGAPASTPANPGNGGSGNPGGGTGGDPGNGTGGDSTGAPKLALSSKSASFGAIAPGDGKSFTFTLTNSGQAAATGVHPWTDSFGFSVLSTTCGDTLAAAESCAITVSFHQSIAAAYQGVMTVDSSAGSLMATLTGTVVATDGTGPILQLSAYSLPFNTVDVGQSSTLDVTVTNSGIAPAQLTGIGITGAVDVFAQSNDCGSSLAAGASCTVRVAFTPITVGDQAATVVVASDAPSVALALNGRGAGSDLKVTPASLDFGLMSANGTPERRSFNITNAGTASAVGISVSTADPAFNVVSSTCGQSMAPAANCSVTVEARPTLPGSLTGTVVARASNSPKAATVNLTGTVGKASLTLSTHSLNFPQTAVGASPSLAVKLTNSGGVPVVFSAVPALSGSSFTITSNSCSSTLSTGSSCEVSVQFSAVTAGTQSGALTFTGNFGTGTEVVTVAGTAVQAKLVTNPSELAFASTFVGKSSAALSVQLSNTGTAATQITGVGISDGGAEFSQSNNCGATLAPGASCSVQVLFAPGASGARSGVLYLQSSEAVSTVTLTGTGLQAQASLTADTDSDFGLVGVGDSVTRTFTYKLVGNGGATGISASVNGDGMSLTNNTCSTSLPASGSCKVGVRYSPSYAGASIGAQLTVASDASNGAVSTPLTASAASPQVQLLTATFPETSVGSSSTADFLLKNVGVGTVTVSSVAGPNVSGEAFSFASTSCGSTLAAGSSCFVRVRFTPTSTQAQQGSLFVATGAGVQTVTLGSTGLEGYVTVNPAGVTFPLQQVRATSAPSAITVTNTGTAALTFSSIGVSNGAANFAQSNNCSNVAVGASCTVNVNFTPTIEGPLTGTLSFVHSGGGIVSVSLTGEARNASAAVGSQDFGDVMVGASSTRQVSLVNSGIGNLTFTTPSAASVAGLGYSFISTSCATSLAPSSTCTLTVRFTPTAAGAYNGTVKINTSELGQLTSSLSGTGLQAKASFSPGSLSFPLLQVGMSSEKTVLLSNTGTADLVVTTATVPNASAYAVSGSCPTVAPGESCPLQISFAPGSAGLHNTNVTLSHNGSGATTFNVTGSAQAPQATLTAPSFVATRTGQSSIAKAVLTNTGLGVLGVTAPTAASVTGSAYRFFSTDCPSTLEVGGSCGVLIQFSPTTTAPTSGNLTVVTNGGSKNVSLGGTGIQGYASISPGSLSFSMQQVGSPSPVQTVRLTNTGSDTLTLAGVGISSGATDFAQTNNCGTVAAGASCTVNVVFTPTAANSRTGALSFVHDGGGTASVNLSGTGQLASATVSSAAPGSVVVNSSRTFVATLTNSGVGPLNVNAPSSDSVSGNGYSFVSSTCGGVLASGSTCTATLSFQPKSPTQFTGSVTLSTAETGPRTGTFSGYGVQGNAAVAGTSLNFGNVKPGVTATKNFLITNNGNGPLTFSNVAITSGVADFAVTSSNCQVVATGQSCVVALAFSPSEGYARTGTLTLSHDGTGARTIDLAGTGIVYSATVVVQPFPKATPGHPSSGFAKFTNTGTGPLIVTGYRIAGSKAFAIAGSYYCNTEVGAGQTCNIGINFAPTDLTPQSATLTVVTNQIGELYADMGSIAMQGYATVDPASVNFSAVQVGQSSSVQSVTVTNTGTDALTFSGIGVSSGTSDFAQSNDCGSVAPGGTCTVNVSFTPSVSGSRSGTLSFAHDGGGYTSLPLRGTAQAPAATFSAQAVPATPVNSSNTFTATLTNTGIADLTVTPPSAASVTGADFAFDSSDCGVSLASGASCAVVVRFAPTASGSRPGTVAVNTAAGNKSLNLTGTGQQGLISLSAGSATFTTTQVGAASAAKNITINNTGTAVLNFTKFDLTAGGQDYSYTTSCGPTLPVGANCALSLTFQPSAAGSRTGNFAVTSADGASQNISLTGTGQAASGTAVIAAFGSVKVGASTQQTFTVTNTGVGTLSLGTPSVSGTDFQLVSTTCGASLAAGSTCSGAVTFTPSSSVTRNGTLQVATTEAGTLSSTLTGTGIQGVLTFNPSSTDFGNQQVGSASIARSVSLTNTGTASLTVSNIGISSGATDFAQTSNCPTIAAGASCTVNLGFSAQTSGVRSGTLSVTHDGAGATSASLSGTGVAPSAFLSAPTIPVTSVGGTSTATSTLTNTGIGTLTLTVPNASSVTGTDFAFVSTTCTANLASGAACNIVVSFTPTSTTARSGNLSVATSAGTQSVTLGSTGIQGYASVSPSSVPFATYQVGQTATAQVVTVTNTGTDTLTFTGVGISTGSSDFAQSNNCGSVPVNSSCTVNVSFTPSTAGARTGTLSFVHNGGGIANVSLSGTGQAISTTLSTPSFTNTQVGSSTTATATLTNTGGSAISVTVPTAASVSGAAFSFVSTTCTTTLGAGANCTVSIKAQPIAAGANTGSLTMSPGGNVTLTVTGTAPVMSMTPASGGTLTLTTTNVGQTSPTSAVTVNNTGNAAMTVSGIGLSNTTEFAQSNNCGTTVAAGGSCTINVSATPSAAGARSSTLTVTTNGGTGTLTVNVTAQQSLATLTPATNSDFGVVDVNTTATRTFTYAVTGGLAASNVFATLTGSDLTMTANTCGTSGAKVTVNSGSSCSVTVQYAPTTQTTLSGASLSIASTTANSPVTSALTGSGGAATAAFTGDTGVDFGYTAPGSNKSLTFTFTNSGNKAATNVYLTVTGAPSALTTTSNTCGLTGARVTVAAAGTCKVTLKFAPTDSSTSVNGTTIAIASSALNGTQSLSLTGASFVNIATGGTITYNGNYVVHKFTTNGTLTFVGSPAAGTGASALLVAGGGGATWGGGGGGGVLNATLTAAQASAGQSYAIVVGGGGGGGNTGAGFTAPTGGNGGNSSFNGSVAIGGGGGGGYGDRSSQMARSGGSGGGGACSGSGQGGFAVGAAGTAGQGNKGGNGWAQDGYGSGAGGGGAGAAAANAPAGLTASNGGAGVNSTITGATVTYGAGGRGSSCGNNYYTPVNALGGTGNGGGAGYDPSGGPSGNGGSGVVIVTYRYQ